MYFLEKCVIFHLVGFTIYIVGFFFAGFIQEALINTYHRALAANRINLATFSTISIALVSLLVVAELTSKIFTFGYWSYLFVALFSLGKGLGTYLCMKKFPINKEKTLEKTLEKN